MHYKKLQICFLSFFLINSFLYLFITFNNHKISFSENDYKTNAHHYLIDPRINGDRFSLLRALGQYDAQWYLKIANEGYPRDPINTNLNVKEEFNGLTYAFFPLYPILVSSINYLVKNVELSAFVLSNILLFANFASLYYVIKSFYSKNIALKTIFLLFIFPFSIFFRSYFTEGLFLLLLIWFTYFLIKKSWILSAFFLSLLFVTRPNGLMLGPLYLCLIIYDYLWEKINIKILLSSLIVAGIPFVGWLIFCFIYTGNPLYWLTVQSSWYNSQNFNFPILQNINAIFNFLSLPLHSFHVSKVDTLFVIILGVLLFLSRKKIKPELWWISFTFWLVPLLFKDTMSFTRYQIVQFPLFLYLAQEVKGAKYIALLIAFGIGLFFLSLFFVNWYWIG